MKKLSKIALVAGFNIALLAGAASSHAAVVVLGGGMAEECYKAARAAVNGLENVDVTGSRLGMDPVEVCTLALTGEMLGGRALAGTYTNRGVLLFVGNSFQSALQNFDRAISIDDDIAEAHVNRGAALVALKQWEEGLDALNTGLAMEPGEAHKAYYNRAIAHEELGNVREAYFDYRRAAEIAPTWEEPRLQLTRFTVTAPDEG